MKNVREYAGTITALNRLPSSTNGNPRYEVDFRTTDGNEITFRTAVDSSIAYALPNYFNHNGILVRIEVGSHYGADTLNDIEKS